MQKALFTDLVITNKGNRELEIHIFTKSFQLALINKLQSFGILQNSYVQVILEDQNDK